MCVLGAGGNVRDHPIPCLLQLSFSGSVTLQACQRRARPLRKGGIQLSQAPVSWPLPHPAGEGHAQRHTALDRGGVVLPRAILEQMAEGMEAAPSPESGQRNAGKAPHGPGEDQPL